jgi:virulence-associated protein VapD
MQGVREAGRAFIGHNKGANGGGRMYAIVFDLDTNILGNVYPGNSPNNAYSDVRRFLENEGFDWQQGSTNFGNETVDAVKCTAVVLRLVRAHPWLKQAIRDIRMLRIEENNDLGTIVDLA